jgi:dTDP-4-dehydrorhamnose 3,5-epimerase
VRVIETALPEVLIVEPQVHRDDRGFFLEVYHAAKLRELGVTAAFVQDNHSRSVKNTLRGLHWQWRRPQSKLVRVVAGEIFDVAVDIRRGSPRFGQWAAARLSAANFRQMYVPEGFAHGFCVLSDIAEVEYKCSDFYDPDGEGGIIWNDPRIGIEWPVDEPLLSARDRRHPGLDPARSDLPSLDAAGALVWSARVAAS